MIHILNDDLIYEILSIVEEIPKGKVASYGQIAKLIGREKNSRLVGKVCVNFKMNVNFKAINKFYRVKFIL